MPALSYPSQATIDTWNIEERGVRDGSSPEERFELNGAGCTRIFRCDWADRVDVVKFFLGYSAIWDNAGTPTLSRLLPQAHPLFPSFAATKVTSVKGIKWTGNAVGGAYQYKLDSSQINLFKYAELTIQYEHVDYEMLDDGEITDEQDRYVSRGETTPSAEFLQLPGGAFKYISASTPPHQTVIPFNVGKILPQEKFILTWRRLPEAAWAIGSNLYDRVYDNGYLGAINANVFWGRPVGTVLFSGVRPILNRSPLGDGFEWDLEYTFDYDPHGWNHKYYYNPAGTNNGFHFVGTGTTIYTATTLPDNYSIYNSRTLENLFAVD